MTKPTKHPVRSLVVNAALVAVAFGLLGLAVWQNQEQIRSVLSRRLDFRIGIWRPMGPPSPLAPLPPSTVGEGG